MSGADSSGLPMQILVISDSAAGAEAVAAALRADFETVWVSADPVRHVADFDRHRAPLWLLAFGSIGQAELCLQRLERSSESLHAFAQRRLLLCRRAEQGRAYQLCRKGHFDDYVLVGPQIDDGQRLLMAAHQAERSLRRARARSELRKTGVELMHRLERLEPRLSASSRSALEFIESAQAAIDALRVRAAAGAGELDRSIDALQSTMGWMRQWALTLHNEWHAELEAARRLRELAGRARPVILAIDDDAFQHKLLRRLLRDEEVELLAAHNVAEAMSVLQVRKLDGILMDIGLPDVDGIEAVRMIKSVPVNAGAPIVMLTGSRDETALQRSLDAGASGYLPKPLSRAMLVSRLSGLLPGDDLGA